MSNQDKATKVTLEQLDQDISMGMSVKEAMESLDVPKELMGDVLKEYLEYSEEWSEGPIESGFEEEVLVEMGLKKEYLEERVF